MGKGRRCLVLSGTREQIDAELDRANLSPDDRAAIDDFRRYLAGEMSAMERHAYEHTETPSDYQRVARVMGIAAGGGTIREAREAAGLSLGQAVRLVPWDRARMEAIEATGVMSPEERVALCKIYDVVGFTDEYGARGGDHG